MVALCFMVDEEERIHALQKESEGVRDDDNGFSF